MGFKQYGDSNSADRLYETTASISLYVETTGNDTTGDGTAVNPFLTIQKAIGYLPAVINHDCYIYVGAGVYTDTTVIRKLTTMSDDTVDHKRLYIVGDPTERLAVLTADGGTRNTITDAGAFGATNYAGDFVEILAGPNYVDLATYHYWSNYYPIRSNNANALTLGCTLASVFTNATQYRIVRNATVIQGDGTATFYGITNYSMHGLEVHVQNIEMGKLYYGVNNYGRAWIQGCSFEYDTTGYSAIFCNANGHTLADGNYVNGIWTNADIGMLGGAILLTRQNYMYDGESGLENDSGGYFFSYGNVVDTMTDYGAKAVNSGIVKGSDNANIGSEYSLCAKQAFYAVLGGQINEYNAIGGGSAEVARTIGASDVIYDDSKLTATDLFTFDDDAGTVTDRNDGTMYTGFNYGGDGSVLRPGSSTEEITVAALAGSGVSGANLVPAGSIVRSVVARVIETTAGPVTNFDVGRTNGGNLDEYVQNANIALNTTARSSVDGDGTFGGSQINAAADTITVTLDFNTPVGDPCTIRVTVYYDQDIAPTS